MEREIENKLDNTEISPLKEFVDSELEAVKGTLKALENARKESETAGAKLRLLR